jgi:glycosyltransferase involved in cell wall biosynthesis
MAVDARELERHPTGVGRVLSGLLSAWPEHDEILLVARRPLALPRIPARHSTILHPGALLLPGTLWEQLVLPDVVARAGADLLLSPAYGMPWNAPCPTVVGMHDCACFALADEFRPRERIRRQWAARLAARRAEFLFMGSQFAADEAHRYLGVERDRLAVLPYGVDSRFRPPAASEVEEVARRYGLEGRIVLFVGAHLQRRMLPALAGAVERLARDRPDVRLALVGQKPEAERLPGIDLPPERMLWLGWVDDADLPAIYAASTVVAYPSRYEGFGLPVLEGLACGAPVVTSEAGSLAEIYQGKAWVVPNDRPDEWERAIATLLDSPAEREHMSGAAQAWAAHREWSAASQALRARLQRTLEEAG